MASEKGHLEVVKTLVASGADINAEDNVGDEEGGGDLDQGVRGDKGGCTVDV